VRAVDWIIEDSRAPVEPLGDDPVGGTEPFPQAVRPSATAWRALAVSDAIGTIPQVLESPKHRMVFMVRWVASLGVGPAQRGPDQRSCTSPLKHSMRSTAPAPRVRAGSPMLARDRQ